jgi:acyl phosphate:glycerol-3-phosphate acyltransferase
MDSGCSVGIFGGKIYGLILENHLTLPLLCLFAFLIGSIPTGLIIAHARGINLQQTGSGNIGATNVLRTTGKWPALLTLAGDILKGVIAAAAGRYFFAGQPVYGGLVGLFAIIGHDFSIFLKFKGGKGVATSLGVLAVYAPQTCLLTTIIWIMTLLITRYSSLGALVSFGMLPFSILLLGSKKQLPIVLVMSVLLFVKHKDNIIRLIRGTEPRVGGKPS